MTIKQNGKNQVVVVAMQLIAGAAKNLSDTTPVVFAGGSFTKDQVTSKLQTLVDLRTDVDASKAATKAKLAREATDAPALIAFSRQFRAFAKASFVSSPDVLADFGITLKSRVPRTAQGKVVAVTKAAATRAARHTMGSKQKAEVKGDVTGVVVTPVTAPTPGVPVPTSPTAPATSAVPTASSPTAPATSAVPTASSPTAPATSAGPTAATALHTA
jgi:hypothetical protein